MYAKSYELIFSVNASLIYDENDYEDLKSKNLTKKVIFCI